MDPKIYIGVQELRLGDAMTRPTNGDERTKADPGVVQRHHVTASICSPAIALPACNLYLCMQSRAAMALTGYPANEAERVSRSAKLAYWG